MTRLAVGDAAPTFTLLDSHGAEVSLQDFTGKKVVVYFYPAALTPGCTKQACDFEQSSDAWTSAGYVVLGISPDEPAKLTRFAEKHNLTFTLLSDPEKKVLKAYGAYGEKTLYGKKTVGVIRSTIVIDEQGVVEQARYNVKATKHVASLANLLGVKLPETFESS